MTQIQFKKIPVELVADYFIWKSNEAKKPITNKKLQKLIYYSQAWSMAIYDKPIFGDKIEAWVHGPAVRSIYLNFKEFGYDPIKKEVDNKLFEKVNPNIKKVLDEIWRVYGKHDAQYLELLTHNEKPWLEAREGLSSCEATNKEICLSSMREYYSDLLTKNGSSRN